MNKRKTVFSIVLALALIIAAAVCIIIMEAGRDDGIAVIVKIDGEMAGVYSLSKSGSYELNGGTNILTVKDGYAFIERADCPGQDCVHQRKISRTGERIVCTYNRISIEVEGAGDEIFIN